jgi:transcriptional regulator with XRE-family HTH domain
MSIDLIKGSKLKILLKRKGILSKHITEAFGLNRTTVSRYFTDDMAMPATFIVKVAFYAKLDINDLITGDPNDVQDFIIDADWTDADTPPVPQLAAEPTPEYQRLPPTAPMLPEPAAPERPVIFIDTSHLDHTLSNLQAQIDAIRRQIEDINK